MLDYYQALEQLLTDLSATTKIDCKPLLEATGLVLAEDILVQYDSPLFDNTAMDGYALGGDLEDCQQWQVIDRVAAGDSAENIVLTTGQAVRIFTGAPIPKGTTAVIQQELTQVEAGTLTTLKPVKKGLNIRYKGEELTQGGLLLAAGRRLTPAMIALLASQGYGQVKVFKPLCIYVFSTGNELLEPSQSLAAGRIYDTNRYLLLSWLQQANCHVIDGGILPDNQLQTEQALVKACEQADVILTSAGVSVGEEDHVRAAIEKQGQLVFWKLAIKPGKPFAWGKVNNTTVLMLPGNPVASLVTFHLLALPALRVLGGLAIAQAKPESYVAEANFSITKLQSRREFLRVGINHEQAGLVVELLDNQGSAMLSTCVKAEALAEIPIDTPIAKGDKVKVYPLNYKV